MKRLVPFLMLSLTLFALYVPARGGAGMVLADVSPAGFALLPADTLTLRDSLDRLKEAIARYDRKRCEARSEAAADSLRALGGECSRLSAEASRLTEEIEKVRREYSQRIPVARYLTDTAALHALLRDSVDALPLDTLRRMRLAVSLAPVLTSADSLTVVGMANLTEAYHEAQAVYADSLSGRDRLEQVYQTFFSLLQSEYDRQTVTDRQTDQYEAFIRKMYFIKKNKKKSVHEK